jgi:hypothetical protein
VHGDVGQGARREGASAHAVSRNLLCSATRRKSCRWRHTGVNGFRSKSARKKGDYSASLRKLTPGFEYWSRKVVRHHLGLTLQLNGCLIILQICPLHQKGQLNFPKRIMRQQRHYSKQSPPHCLLVLPSHRGDVIRRSAMSALLKTRPRVNAHIQARGPIVCIIRRNLQYREADFTFPWIPMSKYYPGRSLGPSQKLLTSECEQSGSQGPNKYRF